MCYKRVYNVPSGLTGPALHDPQAGLVGHTHPDKTHSLLIQSFLHDNVDVQTILIGIIYLSLLSILHFVSNHFKEASRLEHTNASYPYVLINFVTINLKH